MSGGKGAVRPRSGQRNSFAFRLADWLTAAVICVLAAALLLFVIYTPVSITSSGVSDFYPGDIVFASRLGKHLWGFARGDDAVVRSEEGTRTVRHVRRVIALSGEKVTVSGGSVYIGNSLLDESAYADSFDPALSMSFTVPEGSMLLLPDQRAGMTEHDVTSCISPLSDIVGEVRFTAFPPSRLRFYN